jgi:predicted RNA-binding Zn-ribbon protein involved in translation (DUF1610 family)
MTFLEFVCEKLMGPPTSSRGDGQSTWNCPNCGHESKFHTRPHDPRKGKDKFSCWSCGYWGDQRDLVHHFNPIWLNSQITAYLRVLRLQYDEKHPRVIPSGVRGGGLSALLLDQLALSKDPLPKEWKGR